MIHFHFLMRKSSSLDDIAQILDVRPTYVGFRINFLPSFLPFIWVSNVSTTLITEVYVASKISESSYNIIQPI